VHSVLTPSASDGPSAGIGKLLERVILWIMSIETTRTNGGLTLPVGLLFLNKHLVSPTSKGVIDVLSRGRCPTRSRR